jgi:hypothetical protein
MEKTAKLTKQVNYINWKASNETVAIQTQGTVDMIKNIFAVMVLTFLTELAYAEDLTIDHYLDALASENFVLGERQEKLFQLLMAVDGFAIKINNEFIEIYQFDTGNESGKTALEHLSTYGFMGQSILPNNNLGLIKKTTHPDWNRLEAIFMALPHTVN